jgi:hypothetical protein
MRQALDIKEMERDLLRFRSAIEAYVQGTPHPFLHGFPLGKCKTISMLTARFLRERGWGDSELVANGNRSRKRSVRDTHAWLYLHGYTIDLTADQFSGGHRGVILVPEGASSLHRSFRGQHRYSWDDYMHFNDEYQRAHDEMYSGIIEALQDDV